VNHHSIITATGPTYTRPEQEASVSALAPADQPPTPSSKPITAKVDPLFVVTPAKVDPLLQR
jgi:hypothetical protein